MLQVTGINIGFDRRTILENASITLKAGRTALIYGPSGSGKTTLLYRLAMMNTDCELLFEGEHVRNRERFRREDIAFVLQNNELIDYLSVEENLREAALISGTPMNQKRMHKLLREVNLNVPPDQKCSLLSLGERERLCIACALCKNTRIVILDEPTASLDAQNRKLIFELIRRIASKGKYVIFTSHESEAFLYADEVWHIRNKKLVQEKNCNKLQSRKAAHHFRPGRFIRWHSGCYSDANRALNLFTGFFIVMIILCSSFILAWYGNYLEETRDKLYESGSKYLYVTDSRNKGYLDLDTFAVNLEDGYPLSHLTALFTEKFEIIPYYDETDYGGKIHSYLSSEEHGIYFSYRAYESVRKSSQILPEMKITVVHDIPQEITVNVNGVLKQGVRAYELKDNEVYIAMWHEDYEKLTAGEAIGKICFYDTIEQLERGRQNYLQQGYVVNDEAASYEHIKEITYYEESQYRRIRLVLFVISILLISGIHVYTVHRRIREFAILRLNGITGSVIGRMLGFEQRSAVMAAVIAGIICSIIMDMNGLPFITYFLFIFAAFSLVYFVCLSAVSLYLKYVKADRVLRS